MRKIAAIKLLIIWIPFFLGIAVDNQLKEEKNNEKTRLFNPSEQTISSEKISEAERIRLIEQDGGNPNEKGFFKDGGGFRKPKIKTDMAGNPIRLFLPIPSKREKLAMSNVIGRYLLPPTYARNLDRYIV